MAKRYHESKKARHAEHMGMERHERGPVKHHSPVPNSMNRGITKYGSGMISEDRSAPALLPQHVVEKYWPTSYNTHMKMVDDLFEGAQKQLHEDYKDLGRVMNPKKY